MAGIAEIGAALAEAALIVAPELVDIPVVGRILVALAAHSGGETKAIEELQNLLEKKKLDRQTRIQKNARYVLKASEAMKCVETHLLKPAVVVTLARGLIEALRGRDTSAFDLLANDIFTCIEEHVLRQDTPRVISTKRQYHRPARGHGHGRK
jgi:hypothetical protein